MSKKKRYLLRTKGRIPVFTKAFMALQHRNGFTQVYKVECSVDGVLRDEDGNDTFTSIDAANGFAASHRRSNPGHQLSVSTEQVN